MSCEYLLHLNSGSVARRPRCKYPSRYSCSILMKLEFSRQIFEETQISSFIKIHTLGAELFHADGRTDDHDEANSRVSQLCERD